MTGHEPRLLKSEEAVMKKLDELEAATGCDLAAESAHRDSRECESRYQMTHTTDTDELGRNHAPVDPLRVSRSRPQTALEALAGLCKL